MFAEQRLAASDSRVRVRLEVRAAAWVEWMRTRGAADTAKRMGEPVGGERLAEARPAKGMGEPVGAGRRMVRVPGCGPHPARCARRPSPTNRCGRGSTRQQKSRAGAVRRGGRFGAPRRPRRPLPRPLPAQTAARRGENCASVPLAGNRCGRRRPPPPSPLRPLRGRGGAVRRRDWFGAPRRPSKAPPPAPPRANGRAERGELRLGAVRRVPVRPKEAPSPQPPPPAPRERGSRSAWWMVRCVAPSSPQGRLKPRARTRQRPPVGAYRFWSGGFIRSGHPPRRKTLRTTPEPPPACG
jgi:hypothetical protein